MISTKFNIMGITWGPVVPPLTAYWKFEDNGDNTWSLAGDGPEGSSLRGKDIVLPTEYQGKPVTKIKDLAFLQSYRRNSLTIPSSYLSVGNSAFTITPITTGQLTLSEGLKYIGKQAFQMTNLSGTVVLPKTLEKIESAAFVGNNCQFDTNGNDNFSYYSDGYLASGPNGNATLIYASTDLSGEVEILNCFNLGEFAFGFCNNITKIKFMGFQPGSIIGSTGFGYMSNLTCVYLNPWHRTINMPADVFYNSPNLSRLEFPFMSKEEVKNLPNYPWGLDINVVTINCEDGDITPEPEPGGGGLVPNPDSDFNFSGYGDGYSIKSNGDLTGTVILPDQYFNSPVRRIASYGFSGDFTSLVGGKLLELVGDGFLNNVYGFRSIIFRSDVQFDSATPGFGRSDFMTNLVFETMDISAIKNLNYYPWDFNLDNEYKNIRGKNGIITSSETTEYPETDSYKFNKYSIEGGYEIEDSGNYPSELVIPAYVDNDPENGKIIKIKANAFDNNNNLTFVAIGTNVKEIGDEAFAWCNNLSTVIIPTSVEIIGRQAFEQTNWSCKIYFNGKTMEQVKNMPNFPFSNGSNDYKFFCLDGTMDHYGNPF